jgi:hypothetical protein
MNRELSTLNIHGRHSGPTGDASQGSPASPVAGSGDDLSDPFEDDLTARLTALAPRRLATRLTLTLASVALVTSGFVAGALVQSQYGATPASQSQNSANADRGGFARGAMPSGMSRQNQGGTREQGQGSGQNPSTATTTGKVTRVEGATVYVKTSDGRTITVKTTESTTVRTSAAGALGELSAGTTVIVEGTTSGETMTATKVTGER